MLKIHGKIVKTPEGEYGAFVTSSATRQMGTIRLTDRDLLTLQRLTRKPRWDCLAAFSVNDKREIWMYVTRGWTKEEKRRYVLGQCPVLEQIAEAFLSARPGGGRVLLKSDGAFYRRAVGDDVPFARIELPSTLP